MNPTFFKLSILAALFALALPANASSTTGTILPSQKYGWGDRIGWINFSPHDASGNYLGLVVTDLAVTGFAWSRDYGWINFSPSHSGQGVTNTSDGVLGGYAWVSSLGFISLQGATINSRGEFVGVAGESGTDTAHIKFDCSTCSVVTDWRPLPVRSGGGSSGNGGGGNGSNKRSSTSSTDGSGKDPADRSLTDPAGAGEAAALAGATGEGSIFPSFAQGLTALSRSTGIAPRGNEALMPEGESPSYLFDITMRLDKGIVSQGETLVARTSYASFGTLATPVDAVYTILAPTGNPLSSTTDAFIVETERTDTHTFDTANFVPGLYTLHLRVVYGAGRIENFDQLFTIAPPSSMCWFPWPLPWLINHVPGASMLISYFGCWFPWLLIIVMLLVTVLTIRSIRRRMRTGMATILHE